MSIFLRCCFGASERQEDSRLVIPIIKPADGGAAPAKVQVIQASHDSGCKGDSTHDLGSLPPTSALVCILMGDYVERAEFQFGVGIHRPTRHPNNAFSGRADCLHGRFQPRCLWGGHGAASSNVLCGCAWAQFGRPRCPAYSKCAAIPGRHCGPVSPLSICVSLFTLHNSNEEEPCPPFG